MLPEEAKRAAQVRSAHNEALEEMRRAGVPIATMFQAGEWKIGNTRGLERWIVFVLAGLLAKAFKTYRGILALCELGLGNDAAVLLRQLLETDAAIHWLLQKDTRRRSKFLLAHAALRRQIQFDQMLNERGLRRVSKKVHPLISDLTAKAVSHLSPDEIKPLRRHWSGLSGGLEEVTKRLGRHWHNAYVMVYRDTSSTAHVADALKHLEMNRESGAFAPFIKVTPDDDELPRVPKLAVTFMLGAAQRIDKRLSLGYGSRLSEVEPRRSKATRRSAQTNPAFG